MKKKQIESIFMQMFYFMRYDRFEQFRTRFFNSFPFVSEKEFLESFSKVVALYSHGKIL